MQLEAHKWRSLSDVLQPGNRLVAAGYCMYGSATQMVLSFGEGVSVFTLDPSIGEFLLTSANVRIPAKPKTVGCVWRLVYSVDVAWL